MKRIVIILLICATTFISARDYCVIGCYKKICASSDDEHKCASELLKELNCAKDKCDPYYSSDCVDECCKSDNCHDMVSCSSDCQLSIKQLVDLNIKIGISHKNHKNLHLQKKRDDVDMLDTFVEPILKSYHKSHSKDKHRKHRKSSSNRIGYLSISLLSLIIVLF